MAAGSFPSPYEIETPPGCEGWEEMYPYYAVFDERRRVEDEQRFWFWNSMSLPATDAWLRRPRLFGRPVHGHRSLQQRVFAVPPAMGIDSASSTATSTSRGTR